MTILRGTDTWEDVIRKLSQGNLGALRVLCELLSMKDDSKLGWLNVLRFDTMGIYGPLIWMLYKDVFHFNLKALRFALYNDRLDKVLRRKRELSPDFSREWVYTRSRQLANLQE